MDNSLPFKKTNDVNDLKKSHEITHYDEPEENNGMDNIFPSKNTNDMNDLTKSPKIP